MRRLLDATAPSFHARTAPIWIASSGSALLATTTHHCERSEAIQEAAGRIRAKPVIRPVFAEVLNRHIPRNARCLRELRVEEGLPVLAFVLARS
jgi:hypothetical protein